MKHCHASLLWAALAVGMAGLAAGAICPDSTPTLCTSGQDNAAGICCVGSCGADNTSCLNGTSTPVPSLTVYLVFNASDPLATCENQTTAPGVGGQLGDTCTYYVPMANETGGVIGSAALIETTFIVTPGNSRVKTDQTFFFGDNSEVAVNDTLNINGQGWNSEFTAAITGGTGIYAGVRGIYVSRGSNTTTIGTASISTVRKDIYFQ